jgi:SAM-dependent methyltransferase
MQTKTDLDMANVSGYLQKGIGIWLGDIPKEHALNIKTINKKNPVSDYVFDFEFMKFDINVDFILMKSYIRTTYNPILTLAKACKLIKPGGYLLILDNTGADADTKNYYNFLEMEGILQLFEDYIFIENRGLTGNQKKYYYVCRKKQEVIADGKEMEQEDEIREEKGSEINS